MKVEVCVKPLWFGPEDGPLFGWLHVPESGQARGGVLLSPTLGMEAVSAHYAYKRLADRLAEAGFVALRFDYEGTGDSAGPQDEAGVVAAWIASIRIAVGLLRDLGLGRISVVGMRLGATLVAEAFGSGPATIDDLVLWDPCASGRAFLRDQSALWSFALGTRSNTDGSIETPGLVFDKDTVTALSALAIANGHGPLAHGVLTLMRSSRQGDKRMNERLSMPNVRRVVVRGQEELVDVEPEVATVPDETIKTIVEWLAGRASGGPTVLIDPDGAGRPRATVGTAPDGVAIDETAVSLGPLGLFGIVTSRRGACEDTAAGDSDPAAEKASRVSRSVPTVVFFNAGVSTHVGPARLWVQLGRSWAESGFRVVRFDLSGIGDSPVRVGQPGNIVWAPEALEDVLDVLRDVEPHDPSNVILVGLCSGAYQAVEGALAGRIRGLCAVNPVLTFVPPEMSSDAPPELRTGQLDIRRQASGVTKSWARALPGYDNLLGRAVQRLPGVAWWIINRIAVESPPAHTFSKVIDGGVNVLVIAGTREASFLTRGEGRTMRRLRRTGLFRLEVIPELEHSLFERHGRELATGLLTEHVLSCFGPSRAVGSDPELLSAVPRGRQRVE